MNAQGNGLSEDALCSLLDRGVAWLEDFDSRLKNRAVELERREADLAHRMELAEQLERDFAERERQIAETRAQSDEFARRLADQEHALRTREQQDRGEVRGLREQFETRLRDLEDREAALQRIETELTNRRRAVEVCESAIARFQQTFERVLEPRVEATSTAPGAGPTISAGRAPEPRSGIAARSMFETLTASTEGLSFKTPHESRGISPHAMETATPLAGQLAADSWGEWPGPMR